MTIYFYSQRENPYGCFSNFSRHGFELDGVYWQTSEHYFQAQKFAGTPYADAIRVAKTPNQAATMGRSRAHPLRQDWESVKEEVMRGALLRKFETHAEIRRILLDTQDQNLVENAPSDYYWGCGKDGSGQNRLGNLLMEIRSTLRQREGERS